MVTASQTNGYEGEKMDDPQSEYEAIPHLGFKPVQLGMAHEEVRRVMRGQFQAVRRVPGDRYETDCFHSGGFQVFYRGESPVVEYIELSRGCGLRALYKGVDVFGTLADEVVAHVSRDAQFDANDPQLGFAFVFPDLELNLWREDLPESPDDDEGREFSTIGLGVKGYYSSPRV